MGCFYLHFYTDFSGPEIQHMKYDQKKALNYFKGYIKHHTGAVNPMSIHHLNRCGRRLEQGQVISIKFPLTIEDKERGFYRNDKTKWCKANCQLGLYGSN